MKRICKNIRAGALFALLCAAGAGCRVKDVRTASVTAPAVVNAACSNVVEAALLRLPGNEYLRVESIDYATGRITVRYDSMKIGVRNLEAAIAGAGFAAGPFPADAAAAAKLPPECRAP